MLARGQKPERDRHSGGYIAAPSMSTPDAATALRQRPASKGARPYHIRNLTRKPLWRARHRLRMKAYNASS